MINCREIGEFLKVDSRFYMNPIIFLPLVIAIIISISAYSAPEGSIVILENANGTRFTMDFKEWSPQSKCELSLNKGDVLQFEVAHEDGEIALAIRGKNGSGPYTGNNLLVKPIHCNSI